MTIAITCNLSDGVVLGADSAITIEGAVPGLGGETVQGILKTYTSAEKIFRCSESVGIVTSGMGKIGSRSIGSYIREFEQLNGGNYSDAVSLDTISTDLEEFLRSKYMEIVVPIIETQNNGAAFDSLPENLTPSISCFIAGYASNSPLSELWEINIPAKAHKPQKIQRRGPGQFGSNWAGVIDPLQRLIIGYDSALMSRLIGYFEQQHKIKVDEKVRAEIQQLLGAHEFRILYDAMPLLEGVDHVKYLLDVVIHNTRFVIGAPICDAPARMAVITQGEGFEFIDNPVFRMSK